jgi:DUF4097 and DUF4098 domain-containing protein YvlB
MNRHLNSLATLSLLILSLPAFAGTPINETREVAGNVHIRIENVAGSVEVRPGSADRVEIAGTLGEGAKPLRIEGGRDRLDIEVEAESSGWGGSRMDDTDLVVRVPVGARLEIDAVSADVDVAGVGGSHADIETVSGKVVYKADAQRVSLKSVSGSIDGQGAGSDWTVGTVSGRISLPKANGEVDIESVSGAIEVDFGQAERLRAETVSGKIAARGVLLPAGSINMQSVSGAIELALQGSVDARINAKTFSGPISSDFGTAESSGFGGGKSLDTSVGAGSADIRLESFSGRITISGAR